MKTTSIRIAFTVMFLCSFMGWVADVNGTLLLDEYKPGDPEICMEMTEGMKNGT
jgi:hypothetical protein